MKSKSYAHAVFLVIIAYASPTPAATHLDTPLICEQRIANALCLAEPVRNVFRSSKPSARQCAKTSQNYKRHFHRIYHELPPALQREMCSLDYIFIEKAFWASGYAHPKFNAIGIHRRFLDKRTSLSEWATWKERLAFATDQINARLAAGKPINLPVVSANTPDGPVLASYYVVAHELAHRMDLKNGFTRGGTGRFARLSWRGRGRHARGLTLPGDWRPPCFYRCGGSRQRIDLADALTAYRGLIGSSFVSLYATVNPAEDFAETVVYHIMSKRQDLNFELSIGASKVLDLNENDRSPTLIKKLEFVEKLLNAP